MPCLHKFLERIKERNEDTSFQLVLVAKSIEEKVNSNKKKNLIPVVT